MITDPIADMIIRIKNSLMANQAKITIPHSKMKEAVGKLLLENGYIQALEVEAAVPQANIVITPKYLGKTPAITGVRSISKPGRRVYGTVKEIPRALGGYGITIISTSKGIITDNQARKMNVGGEILCQIW